MFDEGSYFVSTARVNEVLFSGWWELKYQTAPAAYFSEHASKP